MTTAPTGVIGNSKGRGPMRILQSWTPQRLTRLRQLWESGLDNEQLADAMQTTKFAIEQILKRQHMVRPNAWPPERTERFKQLWADDNLTTGEIAKAIGLDHQASVSHRAADLGLPARQPKKEWTKAESERLKQLWAKGYRAKRISKLLGRTYDSVTHRVDALGLMRRDASWSEWTRERDAEFRRWYEVEPQLSLKQIALQLGCTYSAIVNRRGVLNLPLRSRTSLVSLAAWDFMNEAQRRNLPEHRIPVRRHVKSKRTPKPWGTKTF
jgi:hypothetical protein